MIFMRGIHTLNIRNRYLMSQGCNYG